jgi:hypothetical protein
MNPANTNPVAKTILPLFPEQVLMTFSSPGIDFGRSELFAPGPGIYPFNVAPQRKFRPHSFFHSPARDDPG